MRVLFSDVLVWLVVILIGLYTLAYARWLRRQNRTRGAFGAAFLAIFTVLYVGFVLFFVH